MICELVPGGMCVVKGEQRDPWVRVDRGGEGGEWRVGVEGEGEEVVNGESGGGGGGGGWEWRGWVEEGVEGTLL